MFSELYIIKSLHHIFIIIKFYFILLSTNKDRNKGMDCTAFEPRLRLKYNFFFYPVYLQFSSVVRYYIWKKIFTCRIFRERIKQHVYFIVLLCDFSELYAKKPIRNNVW